MPNLSGGSPKISNLVLESSSVTYPFYFDKWCKKFTVKPRDRKSVEVRLEETDANFITLNKGAVWWEDLILCPLTVYFKASENNTIIEILEWISKD